MRSLVGRGEVPGVPYKPLQANADRKNSPAGVAGGGCGGGAGPGGVGQDLVLEELGGDHDRRDQQPLPRNEKSSASRMIVKNLMRLLLLILKRWRFS